MGIYKKGSNKGEVLKINTTVGPRFLGVTAANSKTFKTEKGVHHFLLRLGYIKQEK